MKKIAIVAVTRKLLHIIRAMLLGGDLFNEELLSKVDELTEIALEYSGWRDNRKEPSI